MICGDIISHGIVMANDLYFAGLSSRFYAFPLDREAFLPFSYSHLFTKWPRNRNLLSRLLLWPPHWLGLWGDASALRKNISSSFGQLIGTLE